MDALDHNLLTIAIMKMSTLIMLVMLPYALIKLLSSTQLSSHSMLLSTLSLFSRSISEPFLTLYC